ncbi:ribosome small subunit-dependent GTPase A [Mycoplasmatota bacterium WC44]
MNLELIKYGYDEYFSKQYDQLAYKEGEIPARVIARTGELFTLQTEAGTVEAALTGKFLFKAKMNNDIPTVGDFVITRLPNNSNKYQIVRMLNRKNMFSRKLPISGGRKLHKGIIDGGVTEEQVLAANLDYALILSALDNNFNLGRLERYLLLAKRSQLEVVIVLTKLDICKDTENYLRQVKEVSQDVRVLAVSSVTKAGFDELGEFIKPGKTVTLLGSSGVGKSTLLNAFFNQELQKTKQVSTSSGKGKHTTTNRSLFIDTTGCMIIDTPGTRELQLWADIEDLELIYPDIISFMQECKYNNCSHNNEDGCKVNEAIENNELSVARYKRYKKNLTEITRLKERQKEYSQRKG